VELEGGSDGEVKVMQVRADGPGILVPLLLVLAQEESRPCLAFGGAQGKLQHAAAAVAC